MKVHERVLEYINEHHLKQVSIAKSAGIPNSTFNAMLHGKRTMYAEELKAICEALEVSSDIFIPTGKSNHTNF